MNLYIIRTRGTDLYKIGVSKNPEGRLDNLQTGNGEELELVFKFKTNYDFKLETNLHNSYKTNRTIGEWFQFTPAQLEDVKKRCEIVEATFKSLEENNSHHFTKKLKK